MAKTRPDLADTAVEHVSATVPERPAARASSRGASIGRYLVLEELGAGGMGVVYAAYDPELDRKIALKVMREGAGQRGVDSEGRARIMREAQAIARLAHPNVVAAYDVGTDDNGQLFIAMELVDGCTLAAWLAIEERSTGEILDMFAQAGRGLAAAHRAGLMHRDFKPDNVLVGNDGRARVVDFGLVRAIHGEATDEPPRKASRVTPLDQALTQVGAVMGTPMYMAPEQLLQGVVDARTDQYSFCVALYEALADTRPFRGETFGEIAEQILAGKIAEPKSPRKVPARVRAAIKRGMSIERVERFASMDELIAALTREERTRRRTVIAISAAVVVVGVASIGWLSKSAATAPCGNAPIASAWGPQQRLAMQRAFIASGLPFAKAQLDLATRALDNYAHAWVTAYEDSCKATNVRHEQSAEMLDQRTACLHQKRTALATLVELLGSADKELVERAHKSVADLPAVTDCDVAVLSAPTKPADAVTAAAVAHERDELAKISALRIAGKYREAAPRAERVYAAARALRYAPLIGEAGEQVGLGKGSLGDAVGATTTYIEAFGAAAASHADQNAFRVALQLASLFGNRSTFDQAHAWLDVANHYAERLGNAPAERARIHYTRAYIFDHEGNTAASASEYEHARDIRECIAPGTMELARVYTSLAREYDELGRYAEARVAIERSLKLEEAQLGPSHPEIAIVLTTAGNIAVDQGDLDAGQRHYLRALSILEPKPDTFINGRSAANAITNLGAIAYERRRFDEALTYYRRALAIIETLPDNGPDIANAYSNIAQVLFSRHEVPQALAASQRALELAEQSLGKDHPFVGDALLGVGLCFVELHRFREARAPLERALAIRTRGARPSEMADVQSALGRAIWELGERARGFELIRTARAVYAASPNRDNERVELDEWLRTHETK